MARIGDRVRERLERAKQGGRLDGHRIENALSLVVETGTGIGQTIYKRIENVRGKLKGEPK